MMLKFKQWVYELQDLWLGMKTAQLNWRLDHQAPRQELKFKDELARHERLSELKVRGLQLEHDLASLNQSQTSQLAMLKIKCEQDLKDYQHYLASLDQLKLSIQKNYQHLPEVMALTIHHHAKQLLNAMWETQDHEQKMQQELKLIQFMTTLYEEANHTLSDGDKAQLPEKTLQLLKANEC